MLAPLLLALAADPIPLPTRIQEVTVYGSTAHVRRSAQVPRGGLYVVEGLPAALDPSNVRVRCPGGDVVRVEVKERLRTNVPGERLQALRDRLLVLQRDLQRLQDEQAVHGQLREGLLQMMVLDAQDHARDVSAGTGSANDWRASLQFLTQRLAELTRALREDSWKIEDKTRALQAVEAELGAAQGGGSVRLYDVQVEVAAAASSALELEYFVGSAGWTPAYDVRAARELTQAELTYRARVWQSTGEDWTDVALVLSTAQPQRGAQGPEPVTVWVDIWRPPPPSAPAAAAPAARGELRAHKRVDFASELKDAAEDDSTARPFAEVENQGLSARFQLAQHETIQSRSEPTTVLVGAVQLALQAERFCSPALDTTVWLRGKTKNTSEWILLPGTVAVFLGADYLGQSRLETVQTGQEFTLHLGADPAVTVTRTQVQDLSKGPAFLSNRASKVDAWRMHFENHGAVAANKDGSVDVIVREALPRSRDGSIEVAFTKTEPRWSEDARWKREREELGIHTWVLRVPKDGQTDLVLQVTVSYPKDVEVVRG